MHKLLFACLSGIVLVFSSCQSDDPIIDSGEAQGGNTSSIAVGTAVKFTYSGESPTVRSYYDADGTIKWSRNDRVCVVSPRSGNIEDIHQYACYSVGENSGNTSGIFSHWKDCSHQQPIYWHDYKTQCFNSYYPAESIGADPTKGLGAITNINPVTGGALYHVPSDQSLTAHTISTANSDKAYPLAYGIASTKRVPVGESQSVQLNFHDFMNILQIRVNNPLGKSIKGIRLSTTSKGWLENIYPAGTASVIPCQPGDPNFIDGAPTQFKDLCIAPVVGDAPWAGLHPANSITPQSRDITAIDALPSSSEELIYNLCLMPQDYSKGTLYITVLVGDDDYAYNDVTGIIQTEFAKGAIKKLRVDIDEYPKYPYGIYMADITGGTFELGGATDSYIAVRNHPEVTLRDYQMSCTEVTQGQWEAVISDAIKVLQSGNGKFYERLTKDGFSMSTDDNLQLNGTNTGITTTKLWPNTIPNVGGGPHHAAYHVSYNDIQNVFLPILNILTSRIKNYDANQGLIYNLPTEAQWEYAARGGNYVNDFAGATGGDGIVNTTGANTAVDVTQLKNVAWSSSADVRANGYGGGAYVQPVGLLLPNDYGLYDMSGNLMEWCRDSYYVYPTAASRLDWWQTASGTNYVVRGGMFALSTQYFSVTYRYAWTPTTSNYYTGFRLAIYANYLIYG